MNSANHWREKLPIYNVKNKKTGEVKEIFCSYDEKKKYLKDNPDWVSELSAPKIGEAGILSGTNSRKHATGFRDVLERVKTKKLDSCSTDTEISYKYIFIA